MLGFVRLFLKLFGLGLSSFIIEGVCSSSAHLFLKVFMFGSFKLNELNHVHIIRKHIIKLVREHINKLVREQIIFKIYIKINK